MKKNNKMEQLIWLCVKCSEPILPPELIELESRKWETEGTAILSDGKIVSGKVNILGMYGNKEIHTSSTEDKPETYHTFCYRKAGSPKQKTMAGESEPLNEYAFVLSNISLLNELKTRAVQNSIKNLMSSDETKELAELTTSRISGDGEQIEKYLFISSFIELICCFDHAFNKPHLISSFQAEFARQFARKSQDKRDMAKRFDPGKVQDYEEFVNSYLKIAEILEKASTEVKELHENIIKLAFQINEVIIYEEGEVETLDELIARSGWTTIAVSDEISFAYTIGLYKKYKHPEIIVTAISPQLASGLMHHLVEQIENGTRFETDKIYEDEESYNSIYLKVENKYRRNYLGKAIDFYNGLHFPVIQRVSADDHGLFPWDEGSDPVSKYAQKVLGKIKLKKA